MAESIYAAQRWDNIAPKKHRSGGYTALNLAGPGTEPQTNRADRDVLDHYANRPVLEHCRKKFGRSFVLEIFFCSGSGVSAVSIQQFFK